MCLFDYGTFFLMIVFVLMDKNWYSIFIWNSFWFLCFTFCVASSFVFATTMDSSNGSLDMWLCPLQVILKITKWHVRICGKNSIEHISKGGPCLRQSCHCQFDEHVVLQIVPNFGYPDNNCAQMGFCNGSTAAIRSANRGSDLCLVDEAVLQWSCDKSCLW